MAKYKIAIITNIPTPYRIPLFDRLAHHPSLDLCVYFTAASQKNRKWLVELGNRFNYKTLPGFSLRYQGKDFFSYNINPSIVPELLNKNHDVIIAGGYDSWTNQVAFILSRIKRVPFILWSGSTVYESSPLRKIAYPVIRLIVKHCDAYIVYGSRAKEYLISLGASPGKVFIAPNCTDVDFFKEACRRLKPQKERLKNKLGIKQEKLILYVGQLIERKGIKYLIEAFKDLKRERDDIGLMIIGDGLQKHELIIRCEQEGIKDVHLLGFIQKEQLPTYYSIADVFVLPSIREAFAIVVSEAMACGLPVIHTRTGGASADLIKEGANGYVVEDRNTYQLYEALKKILSNSGIEGRMGKESLRIIDEESGLDRMVQGFIDAVNYAMRK